MSERVGRAVHVLRWLSGELAAERHPLAHVPAQLARALLEDPAAGPGCTLCGGELPAAASTGRPRTRCLRCSPRRPAVNSANLHNGNRIHNEEVA